MITDVENLMESPKKLLELINLARLQNTRSVCKSQLYFYILSNQKLKFRKKKKTVPFTRAPKHMKYLGIKLTIQVQDLYTENCKTLLRENNGAPGLPWWPSG